MENISQNGSNSRHHVVNHLYLLWYIVFI
jgi:hypothetical protein